MSKLRVGDIEIDDDSVRIGGRLVTTSPGAVSSAGPAPRPSASALDSLRHFPVPAQILGTVGVLLTLLGAAFVVRGSAWDDPVGALLRGGFLLPLGAGIVGVGLLKWLVQRGTIAVHAIALGDGRNGMLDVARSLLANPERHQTVEWIQKRTNWREADVVRVLCLLRERGELAEELDGDTGDFYYYVTRRAARDLDARLDDINRGIRS